MTPSVWSVESATPVQSRLIGPSTSELVAAALPLLEAGGLLIAASNLQKMDVADYLKELRRGALLAATDLRVIGLQGQGPDFPYPVTFPEGRYLKYVTAVKSAD